jgi:hypothetical protein
MITVPPKRMSITQQAKPFGPNRLSLRKISAFAAVWPGGTLRSRLSCSRLSRRIGALE